MSVTFGIWVAAASVGFIALIFAWAGTAEFRLGVAAALAAPQILVPPLADYQFSVGMLWLLAAVVPTFVRRRPDWRDPQIRALLALIVLSLVSIALLSSNPAEGALLTVRVMIFLGALLLALDVVRERGAGGLDRALLWAAPGVLAEALLVLWFQFDTVAERAFIQSQIGRVLIGPKVAETLYTINRNNVIDPRKAGGFFVNANVASMYLGVAVAAFAVLAIRTGRRVLYLPALLCWVAVFMTGSKTGALLAVILPVVARLAISVAKPARRWFSAPVALMIPLVVMSLNWLIATYLPDRLDDAERTLGYRGRLWAAASDMFPDHPILGLGFGGWSDHLQWYVGRLGVDPSMPPHNLLILSWANASIFAALAVAAFMLVAAWKHLALLATVPPHRTAQIVAWSMVAWLWVFIHGMGDNTAIYGDVRTIVPLAVLGAYVWDARRPAVDEAVEQGDGRHARQPSTSPRMQPVAGRPLAGIGNGSRSINDAS